MTVEPEAYTDPFQYSLELGSAAGAMRVVWDRWQRCRGALEAIASGDVDWGPQTEHLARRALDG